MWKLNYIFENINRALIFLLMILWVLIIVYLSTKKGYIIGTAASLIPLFLLFLYGLLNNPYWSFIALFVANYFVSGISRYIPAIAPGITMDFFIVITLLILVIYSFKNERLFIFRNAMNNLTLVAFIWFLFCLFQILNPNSSSPIAWLTNVRGIGVYFLMITALGSIFLRKYKDLKRILFIWAILSLIGVLKAVIQKFFGFDYVEARWLEEGARSTHILYSGIRYFSFFTDAANFGTGIAFSGVVFAISSLYFKKKAIKVFYFLTSIACAYGMLLSGTRGSIATFFIGLSVYSVLSKKYKTLIITLFIVISAFVFLKFTYIGHGNSYVRRMRSVFNTEDASLSVRVENQMKLNTYMMSKPFGAGIGMSRGRALTYKPDPFLSKIATDSWYVLIWVETGIVGLILHLLILLYIIFHGSYLVLFKLKNHQLRGIIAALTSGLCGIYVSSYSIEIIGQFPFGFIVFTAMVLIFLSPIYDNELEKIPPKTIE